MGMSLSPHHYLCPMSDVSKNGRIRTSSGGRPVLGFVQIVVRGLIVAPDFAGFPIADGVVRVVGRRVVLAGLVMGPGPIVSLAVVELVAARLAIGRVRGIRGACRMQGDARSHRRDQGDSEDGHQGVRHFGSSCANDRRRKDNPSYTVVEVITTRGLGGELYPAATSRSTAIIQGTPSSEEGPDETGRTPEPGRPDDGSWGIRESSRMSRT